MDHLGGNAFIERRGPQEQRAVAFPVASQADERPGEWSLARGVYRSTEYSMPAFSSQSWNGNLIPRSDLREPGPELSQASQSGFLPLPDLPQPLVPRYYEPNVMSNSSDPFSLPQFHNLNQPSIHQGPTQTRKGKKHNYRDVEWDQHIHKIRKLYVDEDRTLDDTMAIMAREHNFHPS
jgi:hypothetical protein